MNPVANQKGAVLLMVLVAVTILGLTAGIAGSSWKTITQRAKEQELLWRGGQIRKAIASYYKTGHAGQQPTLPSSLDDLLRDPRSLSVVRHLRKKYLDPMTGKDWVVVKDPSGRIQGVHSSSPEEPFKQDNFQEENKSFTGKSSYAQWQFLFTPNKTNKTSGTTSKEAAVEIKTN
ncbi:type II secretion system protein [uncultured Desulfuromusa sp.]|uniref:type II secretion system protein n=1 Tax=uncultured Desulfuromusa sp. TaxID=219183 RepID=UPI002AA7F665|nr:type II secretion system protein [uncultured Desulfuromusa sp.]